MTAEKFKSICEEKGITWNDLVRIRVIKPKKFLGFFRQLTGITIEGAFNGCSACVEIMTDDDNGVSMMHYKANEIKDRVLKYVYNIKQERSYNNDLVGIFERYKDIADGDMEVAMNFIKEAYPFNEETESFIRKKFDMPIPDESKEQ